MQKVQAAVALILSLMVSACATVNYRYGEDACLVIGRYKDGSGVILACPSPVKEEAPVVAHAPRENHPREKP